MAIPNDTSPAGRRLLETERLVRTYGRAWFDDPDDLDDCVQQVLVKVWLGGDSFEGRSRFSSWVYAITRNERVSLARTRARHAILPPELSSAVLHRPPPPLDDHVLNRLTIEALLEALPPDIRTVFHMAVAKGLTGPEIALELGLAPASVRSRIFRGRRLLSDRRACA